MINGLLVTHGFIYRFLWMSGTNEVEQLRPNWLTGNELHGRGERHVLSTMSEEA